MNKLLFCIVFTFSLSLAKAEVPNDSIDYWIKNARKTIFSDLDSAKYYIGKSHEYALSTRMPLDLGKYYGTNAIIHDIQANYDTALSYYDSAIVQYNLAKSPLAKANIYNNAGFTLYKTNDLEKASVYYQRAIDVYELQGEEKKLARTYNNLALVYAEIKDIDKAIECFELAMVKSEIAEDQANYHGAMAGKAEMLTYKDRYAESFELSLEAIAYYKSVNRPYYLSKTLHNYGSALFYNEQYVKAQNAFLEALQYKRPFDDDLSIFMSYLSLAEVKIELNQLNASNEYLDSASIKAENLSINERLSVMDLQALLYQEQGLYKKATIAYEKYVISLDSVNQIEQAKIIKDLNTKYEVAQKDKEIAELALETEKNRQALFISKLNFYGIGGISLGVIVFILLYLRQILKRNDLRQQLLNEEIDGLRLRIGKIMSDIKLEEVELDADKLQNDLPNTLTEREVQILQLAITNKSNAMIADEIFLSVNTVKYHLKNIYSKLGVSTRLEAREALSKIN